MNVALIGMAVIGVIVFILIVVIVYACCVVAGIADAEMERQTGVNDYCDGDCMFCNSQDVCKFREEIQS